MLSFDCDFPRDVAVLPQLVEMLDRYDVKASFACIGQWIRAYPTEHRCLVEAGHELLNHTQTHPNLYHPDYEYAQTADLNKE
ncbi:MAG: polysaccharide deacetylase family protein, partial [Rhodospirillales bacterium]